MGLFDFLKKRKSKDAPAPSIAPKVETMNINQKAEEYDFLLPQAADVIFETGQASVSMLQRRLKLGYSRCARMMDQLEEIGVVGPFDGSKPRKILITREQWFQMNIETVTVPLESLKKTTDTDLSTFIKDEENWRREMRGLPQVEIEPDIISEENKYTIIFHGGHVVDIRPMPPGDIYEKGDIIYSAIHVVSDGISYDLSDKSSIASIKSPSFNSFQNSAIADSLGVTGTFDYVLRMRAARFWNEGKYDISIPLLEKATEIMRRSDIGWPKKDYYRIVNELNDLGMLRRAEKWVKWIDKNIKDDLSTIPPDREMLPDFNYLFSEAKYLETDLVESSDISGCCEKCAKYRNRIFSLTGKDSRFPKLPADFHLNCGVSLHPFIYGVMEPTFSAKDMIQYSNRPFVDDRAQEEIDAYQNRFSRIQQMQSPLSYGPDPVRTSYYLIKKYLPNDAPKSMSGYRRMYNSNSKNFQKLMVKVDEIGLRLPKTTDDLLALEASGEFL